MARFNPFGDPNAPAAPPSVGEKPKTVRRRRTIPPAAPVTVPRDAAPRVRSPMLETVSRMSPGILGYASPPATDPVNDHAAFVQWLGETRESHKDWRVAWAAFQVGREAGEESAKPDPREFVDETDASPEQPSTPTPQRTDERRFRIVIPTAI